MTQLYKSAQLVDRSERRISNMDPNCVCHPHWRKVGCLSGDNIGIFATMLKGEICSGEYFSIERGR